MNTQNTNLFILSCFILLSLSYLPVINAMEAATILQEERDTKLMHAADEGALLKVRLLLSEKANPQARSKDGQTALHRAAAKGFREVCMELVRAGAPIDATYHSDTPLHLAAQEGHEFLADSQCKLICITSNGKRLVTAFGNTIRIWK